MLIMLPYRTFVEYYDRIYFAFDTISDYGTIALCQMPLGLKVPK